MSSRLIVIMVLNLALSSNAYGKSKNYRKIQEVNFGEMSLKGTVRNPDGAFLVQKRSLKFLPLYEIQKKMDEKIRASSVYVK